MKPIVKVPSNILTIPAAEVTKFDKKLVRLISDMRVALITTTNPKGVGLAAPQVGISSRIFLTRPHENSIIRVFINPKIVKQSDQITDGPLRLSEASVPGRDNKLEGCLSIPNIWGKVNRAETITLAYQDEAGTKHIEEFHGFLATIIQHETDHVNGILFTHRVLEQKQSLYQSAKDENGKEILEEIELK